MALQLASAGARVKALIPILLGLTARSGKSSAAVEQAGHRDTAERFAVAAVARIMRLSQEAKAALAPLDLPPDGPIDPGATLRARLAPDVAARNFVSWARALDLTGVYSRRSIYALYCEFSEVDERPPLGNTRFLEALAQTEGIAKGQLHNGKMRRSWQWTIEPAKVMRAAETTASAAAPPEDHAGPPSVAKQQVRGREPRFGHPQAVDPSELLAGLDHPGGAPAQRHLPVAPPLDVAGVSATDANHAFNGVG